MLTEQRPPVSDLQWDLVCNQYWLVPVEEVCFILGVLTGCLSLGYAADR